MKNIFDSEQFKVDGELFLKNLLAEMEMLGISVSTLKADHLCFRLETAEQYESYKQFLSREGILLTEAMVNGRAIATYRMNEPFRVGNQVIDLLELPSPKVGTEYFKGFEHAEFVLKESFDQFTAKFPQLHFTKSGSKNAIGETSL